MLLLTTLKISRYDILCLGNAHLKDASPGSARWRSSMLGDKYCTIAKVYDQNPNPYQSSPN